MVKFLDAFLEYTQKTYGPKSYAKFAFRRYETTEKFFKSHNPDLTGLFDFLFEKYNIIPMVFTDFTRGDLPLFIMTLGKYENGMMTMPVQIKMRINQLSDVFEWYNSIMITHADFKHTDNFFDKGFVELLMQTISGCVIGDGADKSPIMTFPIAGNPTEMRMKILLGG